MYSSETWRVIALVFIAVGQTLFALLYMTFPWYRSFLGRALFYKAVALATIIDLGLYARLKPDALQWDRIFVVLYFALGLGVWFQFLVFLHIAFTSKRSNWERGERRP